ncbi:MAG: hypothetical protein COA86_01300 [Kangiella sp.]|nr:MAG: hypothetical protein COA86_01300 [Kangiella sp.]
MEDMSTKYKELREGVENFFEVADVVEDSNEEHTSPSENYKLFIEEYSKGSNTWSYSRGRVYDMRNNLVADIKRNFGNFWHSWFQHPNGCEYLLCGEDYQGYTFVNLTNGTIQTYFPDEAYNGGGFCWAEVFPSDDGKLLAVDGCYWACPYALVLYDFTDPESLPLKELLRVEDLTDSEGWKNNNTFIMTREVECRKADGVPYEELDEEEQDRLDGNSNLVDYKKETVAVKWPQ